MTSSYYRGAHGIILVYDVTNRESFENIHKWLQEIEQYACEHVNKLLVGNNCDQEGKRVVPTTSGQELADRYGMAFIETSAKMNLNVEQAFMTLTRDIYQRWRETSITPTTDNVSLSATASPSHSEKRCMV